MVGEILVRGGAEQVDTLWRRTQAVAAYSPSSFLTAMVMNHVYGCAGRMEAASEPTDPGAH
jgi:hypothetical protein